MKILGVIAEYNPFHKGHFLHLQKARKVTGCRQVIVVMSGHFVQRGEPAIIDKYCRTKMALLSGADLVLELPVYYACASAEFFAWGAVSLLTNCGIVDALCFGAESGRLEELSLAARLLAQEDEPYRLLLRGLLKTGLSYPLARMKALQQRTGEEMSFLREPNNILGVEYLKALHRLQSPIKAFAIPREGAAYHSRDGQAPLPSATALREALLRGKNAVLAAGMPPLCYALFEQNSQKNLPATLDQFSLPFHYMLRSKDREWLAEILDVTEGLEYKIIKESSQHFLLTDLVKAVNSKRYTAAKIRRALLHTLLEIKKSEWINMNQRGGPQYLRVLGFREDSSFLLKALKEKGTLPVITNCFQALKKEQALSPLARIQLEKEVRATNLYDFALAAARGAAGEINREYRESLLKV